jgi:hypothetical protein
MAIKIKAEIKITEKRKTKQRTNKNQDRVGHNGTCL